MATFEECYDRITSHGWLTVEEARLLWDTAASCNGSVVEIGSYHGRSAMLLSQLLFPSGRKLYCVDPWDNQFSRDVSGQYIYETFLRNMREVGLLVGVQNTFQYLIVCRQRVENWTSVNAGMVYCDGDHTEEGTRAQVQKALQCNPQYVAVHDYSNEGGGLEVVKGVESVLGRKDPDFLVQTLAVWNIQRNEGKE